jgi:hypothetical protein
VPPISKFEDKIKLVRDDVAKFNAIILHFDEQIIEKTGKKQFQEFRTECYGEFLGKTEVEAF